MLKDFADIAPKAAVAAVILWAGAHYLVIAPEVAVRIAGADHLPACHAAIERLSQDQATQAIADLPKPEIDRSQERAASQLRGLQNGILGELMRDPALETLFGFDAMTDIAIADYEQGKQAAIDTYEGTIERIKADTAVRVGAAGDLCGCLASEAISATRNDWTIFTASFGLVRPAPIQNFGDRMMQGNLASCGSAGA